jgi:hypothetical protein
MRIVAQLRFGPFATRYHCELVNDEFKSALQRFLECELLPQLDGAFKEIDGTLKATFDNERFCHPQSLVRNIFTIDAVIVDATGTSDLKSDIVYDAEKKSFSARMGHDRFFYAWTPSRKKQRENEWVAVQRVIEDFRRAPRNNLACPICGGNVRGVHEPDYFSVWCAAWSCFRYRARGHQGQFISGSSSLKHPLQRSGSRG